MSIKEKEFSAKLLEWFSVNRKDYPWRQTNDPYQILLAELLLRKTTSKQVQGVFLLLVERYPNVKALADADDIELKKLLKPLGMENKRGDLLKKLAYEIITNYFGVIPADEKCLLTLPGVGKYAANSVLCMSYGQDVPMVDTNAIRVMERVFNLKTSKKRARNDPKIWAFVSELIPEKSARDFNLAIIDFAHEVCRPKKPQCIKCFLKEMCIYGQNMIAIV
ncbi:MAG: hypothetical protein ACQCN3_04140 [Candidatus Bathyarchaeia archaeon]|jgi:A/G-specific adenine glycosylase